MPSNRQHIDRDAKAAEILDAAESLLLSDGYEATTMAAIARGAGVSNNAVYWYFPGKDELLAAVLRRRQEQAFADVLPGPLPSRVLKALAELDSVANLTAPVHERAKYSAAVAEVHESFHSAIDERLRSSFRAAGLSDSDARMAAEATVSIIEGLHLHNASRDPASRDQLVLWALQRFIGEPST